MIIIVTATVAVYSACDILTTHPQMHVEQYINSQWGFHISSFFFAAVEEIICPPPPQKNLLLSLPVRSGVKLGHGIVSRWIYMYLSKTQKQLIFKKKKIHSTCS